MRRYIPGLLLLAALLAMAPGRAPAVPAAVGTSEWKAVGKFRVPSRPVAVMVSEDHRLIFALCSERRRQARGFVNVIVLRCFAADTGKQVFTRDLSMASPLMSLSSRRLAVSDTFDRITVYEVPTWRRLGVFDTRSPQDSPPGALKGVPPELRDFGGGGRLSDLELTPDGKILLTVRMQAGEWKKTPKGAFTAESFQQVTFWDVDRKTRLATLACEDKNANNGKFTMLPRRNQALVRFENGARLLDLTQRKWGTIFPVKDVFAVAVSPDEKLLAVTGRDQGVKLFSLDGGKELLSFKERPINKTPRLDGSLTPGRLEFGPTVQFVDGGKCLRVTLNDGKTVLHRSVASGGRVSRPASEGLRFPGGAVRLLVLTRDGRCAVTVPPRVGTLCTVWQRGASEKGKD